MSPDPFLIMVAASALSFAFLLGYALRSYVSRRRRLRRAAVGAPLFLADYQLRPPHTVGETKADSGSDELKIPYSQKIKSVGGAGSDPIL